MFLLCFNLVFQSSLLNITKKWVPELKHYVSKIPIVLVGCKSDLRDNPHSFSTKALNLNAEEFVSTAEGKKVADSLDMEYVECSAREMWNINKVMDVVLRVALFPKKKKSNGFQCAIL